MRNRIPSWLGPALIYALSVGCLIWVYRDFDWKNELPRVKQIHWAWVVLAVASDILVYVLQSWRWRILLTPVCDAPLLRTMQAVYIGLFANEVLPLRSGEAIRCYLQAKWTGISFPVAVSSALIERFFDGVWLILGFLVTTFFLPVQGRMKYGAGVLAVLVAMLALLLLYAVHRRDAAQDWLARYRWLSVLRHLVEGLHHMGQSRTFYLSAAVSFLYLAMQMVPIYAMMRGYDLDHLTFAHAGAVLVILRLGTVVPGPPGNIGLFNVFALGAFRVIGVDRQTAKGLSGVMFFVITVPLIIAGIIAVASAGVTLRDLQKKARGHMEKAHSGEASGPV
ncbi:MAG: flippase-like domain-containing protein [Acidobacteria bacterium]|nr:flippase-like domain-containing protein [Acidobacteriota bacterium]